MPNRVFFGDHHNRRPTATLAHALAYAEIGWPVIPVHPKDKRPLLTTGREHRLASTDSDQIRRWWRQFPKARIGGRTGVVYDALDIDDNDAALDNLDDGRGPLSQSRPGRHHLFTAPADRARWGTLINRVKVLSGVDARGLGSFVVLPDGRGARHWVRDPMTYDQLPPHPVFDAVTPDELAEMRGEKRPAPPPPRAPARFTETTTSYGHRVLGRAVAEVASAQKGQRHFTVLRRATLVGSWVGAGEVDHDHARDALVIAARACGHPPTCAARDIDDGLAHGARTPRTKSSKEVTRNV